MRIVSPGEIVIAKEWIVAVSAAEETQLSLVWVWNQEEKNSRALNPDDGFSRTRYSAKREKVI